MPKARLALLVLQPAIVLLLSLALRADRGPYWQGRFLDPDYVYLFSALTVAQLQTPLHNDHPGLTVQLPGGAILRAVEMTDRLRGTSREPLAESVVADPERYLRFLSTGMLIAAAVSGVIAGMVAVSIGLPLVSALVIQAAWLLTPIILSHGIRVGPEAMFPVLLPWVGLLLLWYGRRSPVAWSGRASAATGLLLGLLLATKITALPWLALALLPGTRRGAIQIATAAAATVAVVSIPIYSRAFYIGDWLLRLTTHKGKHGTGGSGFIDMNTAVTAVQEYSLKEAPLFAAAILGALALAHHWGARRYGREAHHGDSRARWARTLFVACLALWGTIVMVAKHPAQHYLLPASGVAGAVLVLVLTSPVLRVRHRQWPIIGLAAAAILIGRTAQLRAHEAIQDRRFRVQGEQLVASVAAVDASCTRIYYHSSSSPEYALSFANDFARGAYSRHIASRRPDHHWTYNVWRRELASSGRSLPLDTLSTLPCVVLQGTPREGPSNSLVGDARDDQPDPGLRKLLAAHTQAEESASGAPLTFEPLSQMQPDQMAWLVRLR